MKEIDAPVIKTESVRVSTHKTWYIVAGRHNGVIHSACTPMPNCEWTTYGYFQETPEAALRLAASCALPDDVVVLKVSLPIAPIKEASHD